VIPSALEVDMRAALLVSLATLACGGGEGAPPVDAAPTGWQPLITKGWQLPPGGEDTSDIQLETLERDIFAGGIRPIEPPGTHHTVLAQGAGGFESINIIYASGVGTNELVFPPGVGMRLNAGMLIALQLHIFNPSEQPLSGESGVEILHVDPDTITDEVDLLLAGPTELALPPGPTTVTGTCTITRRQTLFALFPHMHQLGTHFKTTLTVGGETRVLHDAAYDFNEQAFLPIEPVVLEPGDQITSECTYFNSTSQTVTWGESSTTEMCFSILYRFPSGGGQCD
jgi:hypothetical protein